MLVKNIKNNTDTSFVTLGVQFDPYGSYLMEPQFNLLWAVDAEVESKIKSGNLIVNNGTSNLTSTIGLDWIHRDIYVANEEYFHNVSGVASHFSSNDVQGAIEETYNKILYQNSITGEPTGFPNRTDTQISFDDSTLTFKIEPTADSYLYYIQGEEYKKTSAESIVISSVEGFHAFSFDQNASLVDYLSFPELLKDYAYVANVYWDASNLEAIYFGDERHAFMPWHTHQRLHKAEGARIEDEYTHFQVGDYTLRGDGSSNIHAQFSISEGVLWDEDIFHSIVHANTPTEPFEQYLNFPAKIPIFYKIGSETTPEWRKIDATDYPVAYDSTNPIQYNKLDSGTWSLDYCGEGEYMIIWILITNNIYEPVIAMLGEESTSDLSFLYSVEPKEYEYALPSQEYVFLYKLIFRTYSTYTNVPKAVLVSYKNLVVFFESEDRYNFGTFYIGSAGSGKYLEVFKGSGSDESPFIFPEDSFIRAITIHTTALNTGTIGFFVSTDLVNPVFSVSLSNESFVKVDLVESFQSNEKLMIRVTSGSFSKPTLRIFVQTAIT